MSNYLKLQRLVDFCLKLLSRLFQLFSCNTRSQLTDVKNAILNPRRGYTRTSLLERRGQGEEIRDEEPEARVLHMIP